MLLNNFLHLKIREETFMKLHKLTNKQKAEKRDILGHVILIPHGYTVEMLSRDGIFCMLNFQSP